jgi:hypothetical protein
MILLARTATAVPTGSEQGEVATHQVAAPGIRFLEKIMLKQKLDVDPIPINRINP